MKACIVYETRYGNTEKIAKALETGLKESGFETSCASFRDVSIDALSQNDLICVGAPTEWLSAPKQLKGFVGKFDRTDLRGKSGFAFDTKLSRPLSGSAAGYLEKEIERFGIRVVAHRESAIVYASGNNMASVRLRDGEEQRFREIGLRIGRIMMPSGAPIPA